MSDTLSPDDLRIELLELALRRIMRIAQQSKYDSISCLTQIHDLAQDALEDLDAG
jgi:hypothetical protein